MMEMFKGVSLEFMPYLAQIVLALIDGPKIQYKGSPIGGHNRSAFLNDSTVPDPQKDEHRRQYGEYCFAEDLHDKNGDTSNLVVVEDYMPNTSAQEKKIIDALAAVPPLPASSRLYIVGHHDPTARRLAGLTPEQLGRALSSSRVVNRVGKIVLVACHSAGEAGDTAAAGALLAPDVVTYGSELHRILGKINGIFTTLNAYTCFVQISAMGRKRTGFDAGGGRAGKAAGSKVTYTWDQSQATFVQNRAFVY